MIYIELEEEMEMPCHCKNCGEWFDLHDGRGSKSWYPGTVICKACSREEAAEMEADEEEEDEPDGEDDFNPDACPVCGEDIAGHPICLECGHIPDLIGEDD